MIRAEAAIAAYRQALGVFEPVVLRRRFAGNNPVDAPVQARVTEYRPHEVVGLVQQGDMRLVVMAEDLDGSGFPLPLKPQDLVLFRGRTAAVDGIDDNTRRIGGVLIAYELRVRGH